MVAHVFLSFDSRRDRCFSSHVFGSFGTSSEEELTDSLQQEQSTCALACGWSFMNHNQFRRKAMRPLIIFLILKTAESAVRVAGERINPCPWPPGLPTIENRHRIGRMPIPLGMPERIEVHDRRSESARVWNLEILLHLQRYCPTQRMADDASDVFAL